MGDNRGQQKQGAGGGGSGSGGSSRHDDGGHRDVEASSASSSANGGASVRHGSLDGKSTHTSNGENGHLNSDNCEKSSHKTYNTSSDVNMLSAVMHVGSDLLRSFTTLVEAMVILTIPSINSVRADGVSALTVSSLSPTLLLTSHPSISHTVLSLTGGPAEVMRPCFKHLPLTSTTNPPRLRPPRCVPSSHSGP